MHSKGPVTAFSLPAVVLGAALVAGPAAPALEASVAADVRMDDRLRQPGSAVAASVSNKLRRILDAGERRSLRQRAAGRGVRTAGGRIMVDVALRQYVPGLRQRMRAAGAVVRHLSARYLRASALVSSRAEVDAIGSMPEVLWVRPEYGFRARAGSVTSRAVDALHVTEIASSPDNLTGNGQRIGLLSDSFARTHNVVDGDTTASGASISASGNASPVILENATPQDSGDLPAQVELRRDDVRGEVTDEGAAMAELAHDIAPGAELVFHTVGNSVATFASAIDDLCTGRGSGGAGATVVVDDILFLSELMYQPDIVSRAAADCVSAGIPFFSAAGNDGDSAFRREYVDANPGTNNDDGPAGPDYHDWSPDGSGDDDLGIRLDPGERFTAVLQWNQPGLGPGNFSNGPRIDLDLYLFDQGDNKLAQSIDDQQAGTATAGLPPFELVSHSNGTGSPQTVFLRIDHWAGSRGRIPQDAGTDLEFRLVIFETGSLDYEYTPRGPAIYGHPVADGVMSVAAVPWWEAPAYDPANQGPTPGIDPETFTSRGGRIPQFFAADGRFRAATDFAPDLAAVDGNNNTFFGQSSGLPAVDGEPDGFPNFFGTSAAAPNAAAVTALLRENNGSLPPGRIERLLEDNAIDVTGRRASPGRDAITGHGLIDAAATLEASGDNGDSGGGGGGGGGSIGWLLLAGLLALPAQVMNPGRGRIGILVHGSCNP